MQGHVDGNALAGLLSEVFAFDATTSTVRCSGCGDSAMLAQAMVYGGEQGYVVRCKSCEGVLMTVVDAPEHRRIQMRGVSWLETAQP
jgi:uncharacterized Zn finger protein